MTPAGADPSMPREPLADLSLLSGLLEGRSGWNSDAPALSDGSDSLTYGELRDCAGRVASQLVSFGVQPGDRVGVHMSKSVWSFAAVHGVLRAGAVMVPLDSFAPVDHTVSVIVDASVAVVLTDARATNVARLIAGADLIAAIVKGAPDTDAVQPDGSDIRLATWDGLDALDVADPVAVAPDDPAYVIYTSGSTGRPKGIVHTHRSALAYVRIAAAAYDLRAADRFANIASLHFDQSTFELYVAPAVGAAVTVVPDAVLRFPASLAELIEREQVTVWYSVPYVLRQLVERGAAETRDFGSIRWVLYGGESYPPGELADLMCVMANATVSNVYGPAEVNQCTRFDLDQAPDGSAPIPIGGAWDETELVVVDADLVPVLSGPGELLVATSTMMDRYWNRPDLTEAAIIERSYPGREQTRWYRTGDLVAADDRGDLVFLGRADNQVKIRGQRVELEAIDMTIRRLEGVDEVAVVADVIGGDLALVAVIETSSDVTLRDVQRLVAASHARVAVPVELVTVDALARTATDKVDRKSALGQAVAARTGVIS